MVDFKKYAHDFYRELTSPSQGSIILFNDLFQIEPPCVLLQKSVPRSNPLKVLDPVGIVIIENECDLIEDESDKKVQNRYRKTETIEFLYVYDAAEFLAPIIESIKNRKKGSEVFLKESRALLRFLENADIDNMNFYLPSHSLISNHFLGLIVYCKKSQVINLNQIPLIGKYATINPPHRDKLRNFHLKYDLRVPSDEIENFDIFSWLI